MALCVDQFKKGLQCVGMKMTCQQKTETNNNCRTVKTIAPWRVRTRPEVCPTDKHGRNFSVNVLSHYK